MKFINRKEELEFLGETWNLSKRKFFSVVIYGMRRVGKTRLTREFIKEKGIYFFVSRNKTSFSLLKEFEDILKERKLMSELESFRNWDDFFEVIFKRYEGVVVFDEFQNFNDVDKSVFSVLQKFIDLYENKKNLLFIFQGSMTGLIKKIFRNKKEPLYGRIKRKLFLNQLSLKALMEIGKELNIEDIEEIIKLYDVFGGFPRYYVAIEDEHLEGKSFEKILERFFLSPEAVFEDEVQIILSLEFGKRKGRYYDILSAIANGNSSPSKISSFLSQKETKLSRYLNELQHFFEMVKQEKQVIGKKKLLVIDHPLINFWFRLFYKELSVYKSRTNTFIEKTRKEVNNYLGERFETFCREFLVLNPIMDFDEIGRQWGKIPNAPKDKNQYEIDLCAINRKNKEILFGECKWQDNIDVLSILDELKEKAEYVPWHNKERKEYFAVFAKSFKMKIDNFNGKKVYCFDLNDIERVLSSTKQKPSMKANHSR